MGRTQRKERQSRGKLKTLKESEIWQTTLRSQAPTRGALEIPNTVRRLTMFRKFIVSRQRTEKAEGGFQDKNRT